MWYKVLILIIFCYFLALVQNSFLAHLDFRGVNANLILILVCLLAFFEDKHSYSGIVAAIVGGMFLDILSGFIIGISSFSFLIIYFLTKEILSQLADVFKKYSFLYFLFVIIVSVVINEFLLDVFYKNYPGFVNLLLLVKILYNAILAAFAFWMVKAFFPGKHELKKIQSKKL